MKKTIFSVLVLSTLMVNAQRTEHYGRMGLNTTTPNASWEVRRHTDLPETSPQGVLFPRLSTAQRDKFILEQAKHEGLMIYNTDNKCIEMYTGVVSGVHQWSCLVNMNTLQQQNLSITPAGFEGNFYHGIVFNSNNKVKFRLVNNSHFGAINNADFSSAVSIQNGSANITATGVNVNNVSLAPREERILEYTLSGSPENGTLTANFSGLGLTALQSTTVGTARASFSSQTYKHDVFSFVHNSTAIQGKIDNGANKITVKIPYTSGSGIYNSYSNTQTTATGQGNDTNPLTLSIPAGNFQGSGELTATITVGGDGEYLVKQMAAGQEYVIATFPIDINGSTTTVVLKGMGGIPDRKFNEQTDGEYKHRFVYLPIEITNSWGYKKTWLNNNLGAEYANANNPNGNFNPTKQATSKSDHLAYGSLYQWQRPSDGHELVAWTGARAGIPSGIITTVSNNDDWTAGHSNFINSSSSSWVNDTISRNGSRYLWQVNGANNPCPVGYHVPTYEEMVEMMNAMPAHSLNNFDAWANGPLRLPASPARFGEVVSYPSSSTNLWTSTFDGNQWLAVSVGVIYDYSTASTGVSNMDSGYPIRCVQD